MVASPAHSALADTDDRSAADLKAVEDVQPEDAPELLRPYGYAANGANEWCGPLPELRMEVVGHSKSSRLTYYHVNCSLYKNGGGPHLLAWQTQQRLSILRAGLHDFVKRQLGDQYKSHFGGTPFAHRYGPVGTTARLDAWCKRLAHCINSQLAMPTMVAVVLRLLQAPSGVETTPQIDQSPAVEKQLSKETPDDQFAEEVIHSPAGKTTSINPFSVNFDGDEEQEEQRTAQVPIFGGPPAAHSPEHFSMCDDDAETDSAAGSIEEADGAPGDQEEVLGSNPFIVDTQDEDDRPAPSSSSTQHDTSLPVEPVEPRDEQAPPSSTQIEQEGSVNQGGEHDAVTSCSHEPAESESVNLQSDAPEPLKDDSPEADPLTTPAPVGGNLSISSEPGHIDAPELLKDDPSEAVPPQSPAPVGGNLSISSEPGHTDAPELLKDDPSEAVPPQSPAPVGGNLSISSPPGHSDAFELSKDGPSAAAPPESSAPVQTVSKQDPVDLGTDESW